MRSIPQKCTVATLLALVVSAACACGKGAEDPSIEAAHRRAPTAEVAELEIRSSGIDRFVTCPPPGELGQHWIPALPAWTPPPKPADAPQLPVDQDFITRTSDRTPTELAVDATHRDFRSCFRKGLIHDPTQDGRVAIVLRVGPDGRVAKVEAYAACEIQPESIACMESAASRLRFPPPASGSDTITIPAVFTSRDGVRRTTPSSDETYTASAFLVVEGARPAMHACEEQARRELRPVQANATFTLDVRADGSVARANVDPWTGDQALLMCAAKELEKLRFTPPPAGTGTVVARVNFNPRQGVR